MTTIDLQQIRTELNNFLRYSDVLSTTIRGVTRVTDETWTVGVGGEATHTLANSPAHDVVSLTVDGTTYYYLRDYTVNWATGVITWNTSLNENDVVLVTYDHGSSGDKIYPDFPRDDLTLTSFPRIGIELTSITTMPLGLGGSNHISDFLITIIVYVPVNKDSSVAGGLGGLADLEEIHRLIRDAIRGNAKLFYTFPYITPAGTGPLIKGRNNKLLGQSQDFRAKFRVE